MPPLLLSLFSFRYLFSQAHSSILPISYPRMHQDNKLPTILLDIPLQVGLSHILSSLCLLYSSHSSLSDIFSLKLTLLFCQSPVPGCTKTINYPQFPAQQEVISLYCVNLRYGSWSSVYTSKGVIIR